MCSLCFALSCVSVPCVCFLGWPCAPLFTSCVPCALFSIVPLYTPLALQPGVSHCPLVSCFLFLYLNPCVSSILGLSVSVVTRCSCLVSCCLTAPCPFVPACE